jgi:hypothetical protein
MLTEDEIMGGIGFGNDSSFDYPPLSLSKYGKNIPDEIELDNGDTIKKYMQSKKSINLPLDSVPHYTFISDQDKPYYTSMMSPAAKAAALARENTIRAGIVTSPLDPSGKLSTKSSIERFREGIDNAVQGTLGDNTISILLTIVFVLIIALVVLQIIHARKVHKLIKTFMKSINELHMVKKT